VKYVQTVSAVLKQLWVEQAWGQVPWQRIYGLRLYDDVTCSISVMTLGDNEAACVCDILEDGLSLHR